VKAVAKTALNGVNTIAEIKECARHMKHVAARVPVVDADRHPKAGW